MKLRTATITETKLLFDWANESCIRNNDINTNQIIWDDHIAWFEKKLENKNSFIFIVDIDVTPIGQIPLWPI